MEKEINSTALPLEKKESKVTHLKSKIIKAIKELLIRWRKYSWALILYQTVTGLLLVYLTVLRNQSFLLVEWVVGLMTLLFLIGGFYGWFVGKRTGVSLSKSNEVVFQMGGQWRIFLPVLVILLLTRGILMIINWQILFDMTPVLRSLPLVIAGMITTRGMTLFFKYFKFKRGV